MKTLRVVLGDQLSHNLASLQDIDAKKDIILMCEVLEETQYVKHHKKKIVFLFSAMRHFAQELKNKGYRVHYTKINASHNTGSFSGEVACAVDKYQIERIVITEPGEYRVLKMIQTWSKKLHVSVDVREDDRFLASRNEFAAWAESRKQLRMEYFYREMRQKYNILMHQNKPIGGQWNFDQDNRLPATDTLTIPKPYRARTDSITDDVVKTVEKMFNEHFGDIEPFHFAVTRKQALKALKIFIDERLKDFGSYQDAMVQDEPWMYHAHIGLYLNCGLLLPLECIQAAEKALKEKKAPINSVEGFIRQILGWREFIRGIYWHQMPNYAKANFFEAKRKLPSFYWDANTSMNCLRQCVQETKKNAYAHHIQRLMVLGNFALLADIHPKQVNEWFLTVYADAYEWVELPNVTGMALFADGGILASKPYAAGGSYIKKMSNYCDSCRYKVQQKNGPQACPFNYLYWDFLQRHRTKLKKNPRVAMMYRTYDRMTNEKKQAITDDSRLFLKSLS